MRSHSIFLNTTDEGRTAIPKLAKLLPHSSTRFHTTNALSLHTTNALSLSKIFGTAEVNMMYMNYLPLQPAACVPS